MYIYKHSIRLMTSLSQTMSQSIYLPTIDAFHSSIPLTSTPKVPRKSSFFAPPLSSTLSTSKSEKMNLSISAIVSSVNHQRKQRRRYALPRHSSRRIQLKHILYATRAMKERLTNPLNRDLKIYLI